ncbi:MAG: homocysteine S-methyltransferase family protein [Clostridiales bacterium]|jgi:5-methyltetrahydrofolate--homocysteine methyltransferase|nr:homocysteine S-methyltransferase family protein [Clostridiales bacterium]
MTFTDRIGQEILFFDGSMGALMQSRGLPAGESPVDWNITRPERVIEIHREYLDAGADIISTNTFTAYESANREKIIDAAFKNARAAAVSKPNSLIAFDMGPTGRLLSPMGDLSFEECYNGYKEMASQASALGADLVIIETMTDLLEMKAAILAAKSTGLPVVCSMTFNENGRTVMGTDPYCFTSMAQALGVSALGANCGVGPDALLKILPMFLECAAVPLVAQPNAGMPETVDGKARYKLLPGEFADTMRKMAKKGVKLIGGCCGTTPAHIKAAVQACAGIKNKLNHGQKFEWLSSASRAIRFKNGKTEFGYIGTDYFGDFDALANEAFDLEDDGAEVINLIIDGASLPKAVGYLQELSLKMPLSVQTSDPEAAEAAFRIYRGRPMMNITGLDPETSRQMKTIAERYGALIYEYNNRH